MVACPECESDEIDLVERLTGEARVSAVTPVATFSSVVVKHQKSPRQPGCSFILAGATALRR